MYILISYWVALWFCSFAVGTTFPLSNFKTKHIFGILMAQVQSLKPFGAPPAPQFFLSLLKAAEAAAPSGAPVAPQVFFSYSCLRLRFPKWAPMAPLPRRAREIPPKAGVSRVYYYNIISEEWKAVYIELCDHMYNPFFFQTLQNLLYDLILMIHLCKKCNNNHFFSDRFCRLM